MLRFVLLCLAGRGSLRGFALVASVLVPGFVAGCSGADPAVTPPEEHAAQDAAPARPQPPAAAENPLPLDSHASAVIPRWYLPSPAPERPAFTPHWYTPSVDPLFRRRAPHPGRMGTPADGDAVAAPERAPERAPQMESRATDRQPPAQAQPVPPLKDFDAIAPHLAGVASWYGPGFHGKPTANGEIYDQHRMTAAHPSLPMDTIIRVENEANGRVVWVRVNDRGPYAKGRILDLSRAAAERLGMVDDGTAAVRISVLRWPHSTDHALGLRAYTQYVVQVAAYPEPDKAESLRRDLQRRFDGTEFLLDPRPNGVLAVVAGPYDDNGSAQRIARLLRQSGVTSLVRRYRK
jgi:rare lipoprotein A